MCKIKHSDSKFPDSVCVWGKSPFMVRNVLSFVSWFLLLNAVCASKVGFGLCEQVQPFFHNLSLSLSPPPPPPPPPSAFFLSQRKVTSFRAFACLQFVCIELRECLKYASANDIGFLFFFSFGTGRVNGIVDSWLHDSKNSGGLPPCVSSPQHDISVLFHIGPMSFLELDIANLHSFVHRDACLSVCACMYLCKVTVDVCVHVFSCVFACIRACVCVCVSAHAVSQDTYTSLSLSTSVQWNTRDWLWGENKKNLSSFGVDRRVLGSLCHHL